MSPGLYTPQQEENIYIRKQAAVWEKSGLITAEQLQWISEEADPRLRQTNLFFRVLFFVFTLVFTGAMVGLFGWLLDGQGDKIQAGLVLFFGVACLIAAEVIIAHWHLYRHGLEEAFFLAGMILPVISFLILAHEFHLNHSSITVITCLILAALSGMVYLRAGYLYAAFIGITALCALPFQFFLPVAVERLSVMGILFLIFLYTFTAGRQTFDFQKDKKTTVQACLLGAIYVIVNLHLSGLIDLMAGGTGSGHFKPDAFPKWMYWTSYVLAFILPAAGIVWGIKSRRPLILNASFIMACATLATNKSYLGWTRYAWDPAILGAFLIILSLVLSRWLEAGPRQNRFGFTAKELLKPGNSGINPADVAAALTPGVIAAQLPPESGSGGQFLDGGTSGGGGAERKF